MFQINFIPNTNIYICANLTLPNFLLDFGMSIYQKSGTILHCYLGMNRSLV